MQITLDQAFKSVLELQEKFNKGIGNEKLIYINSIVNELNNISNELIKLRSHVEVEFSHKKIEG